MDELPIKDASILYDQDRFSDLTIKLSNGECVKVHRIVLCTNNKYFDKLCGPESHFAERDQPVIELMDDDPEALKAVLRYLYGFPVVFHSETWRFWVAVRTTADKYLEPQLSQEALDRFRGLITNEDNTNELASMIMVIKDELGHDESLVGIVTWILHIRRGQLLRHEGFREWLRGENDIMLDLLSALR